MGQLSKERLVRMDNISHKYFDWMTTLQDAGVKDIQDLQGQYLLKCPFHEDKRPSFRIRVHEHNYHCFSCNAFGTVLDLMHKLSGQSISKAQYYEQVLKRTPAMQQELGFNSLYIDNKSLDEGFNTRRKFSAANHIGSTLPVSVLGKRLRAKDDSWANLTYSLTLLQEGETTDNIEARLLRNRDYVEPATPPDTISLLSLLPDGDEL